MLAVEWRRRSSLTIPFDFLDGLDFKMRWFDMFFTVHLTRLLVHHHARITKSIFGKTVFKTESEAFRVTAALLEKFITTVEADGAAWHDDPLARADDAERQAMLEAHGERVLRVTWSQAIGQPTQTLARIARAYA